MQYYEYIKWSIDIWNNLSSKDILGRSRYKKIKKLEWSMVEKNILLSFFEDITTIEISNFYYNLYIPNIGRKSNANIINIPERIEAWIKKWKKYYYIELKNENWEIIAGTILSQKQWTDTLTSWYSCTQQWYEYLNKYMEYLFFEYAIRNDFKSICLGITPNLGWYKIGSWPSVALHKIELYMKPYVTRFNKIQNINIKDINKESILFISDDDKVYSKALVFIPMQQEELVKKYEVLEKRWITISYHYF